MKHELQKKRKILIIGAIVLIFLTVFFSISFWRAMNIRRAADSFKEYLLYDLSAAELDESGRGPTFDFYLYGLIESTIMVVELEEEGVLDFFQEIDLERYEKRAKEAEKFFLTQCEKTPEECHPLWSAMPYCMAQRGNKEAQGTSDSEFKKQIREVPAFVETLEYWRNYFEEREWQKEDLGAVLGVVMSEHLCGDMQNIDVASWSKKTIGVETDTDDLSEKMRHSSEKTQILSHLHNRARNIDQIPSYEGLEKVCIMPSERAILAAGSVCDLHYYYRNKVFCTGSSRVDYRITEHLEGRHSNPEKIICQLGLWWRSRGI